MDVLSPHRRRDLDDEHTEPTKLNASTSLNSNTFDVRDRNTALRAVWTVAKLILEGRLRAIDAPDPDQLRLAKCWRIVCYALHDLARTAPPDTYATLRRMTTGCSNDDPDVPRIIDHLQQHDVTDSGLAVEEALRIIRDHAEWLAGLETVSGLRRVERVPIQQSPTTSPVVDSSPATAQAVEHVVEQVRPREPRPAGPRPAPKPQKRLGKRASYNYVEIDMYRQVLNHSRAPFPHRLLLAVIASHCWKDTSETRTLTLAQLQKEAGIKWRQELVDMIECLVKLGELKRHEGTGQAPSVYEVLV